MNEGVDHFRSLKMVFAIEGLGQAGFRLRLGDMVIFLDPYLSDRVERLEGRRMRRLRPIPVQPADIADADFVLISHEHTDHCDIDTLLPMAQASPGCRFIGPRAVVNQLTTAGIDPARTVVANRTVLELGAGVQVTPIAAAHKCVEEDFDGFRRFLGYVIEADGRRILHTGDTCVTASLLEQLKKFSPFDVALLPVNECNYFRDRAGIIGNMSIREAFQLGEEIGAKIVVPMHYDMFEPNSAYREEIEIIYQKKSPAFRLELDPEKIGTC